MKKGLVPSIEFGRKCPWRLLMDPKQASVDPHFMGGMEDLRQYLQCTAAGWQVMPESSGIAIGSSPFLFVSTSFLTRKDGICYQRGISLHYIE